jgi:hypothetical protein
MKVITFLLFFFAVAMPAEAYIDPNTGGLIAQVLTPMLIVLGATWAAARHKISTMKDKMLSRFTDHTRNGDSEKKQ